MCAARSANSINFFRFAFLRLTGVKQAPARKSLEKVCKPKLVRNVPECLLSVDCFVWCGLFGVVVLCVCDCYVWCGCLVWLFGAFVSVRESVSERARGRGKERHRDRERKRETVQGIETFTREQRQEKKKNKGTKGLPVLSSRDPVPRMRINVPNKTGLTPFVPRFL